MSDRDRRDLHVGAHHHGSGPFVDDNSGRCVDREVGVLDHRCEAGKVTGERLGQHQVDGGRAPGRGHRFAFELRVYGVSHPHCCGEVRFV